MDYVSWDNVRELLRPGSNAAESVIVPDFPCYAYVLLTHATKLEEYVGHLPGLHVSTGEYILILAPRTPLQYAPDQPLDAEATSLALAKGYFINHIGERVDTGDLSASFRYRVESASYDIADLLHVARSEIPGVAFLSRLHGPDRLVYCELPADGTMTALRQNMDRATDAVQHALGDQVDVLDAVRDRLRAARQRVREQALPVP